MTGSIGDHVPNPEALDAFNRFRSYMSVEENVSAFFRRDFLARQGWRAVVLSEELTLEEANDLAHACKTSGYKKAVALDIDHFDSGFFYEISLNKNSLSMLEEIFLSPSYLVVEEKERFMMVSDSDYYWAIAGSAPFLERCFKKPIDVMNQEFLNATQNYRNRGSKIGQALSRIAGEILAGPIGRGIQTSALG